MNPRPSRIGGMAPFLFGVGAMFAAMYSTQAILPELSRDFGVSPSRAGLTISVLIVALAAGAWLWGPLSDRIGRRRSLVLASGLLVVPTLAAAVAPSFGALLAVRAIQGLCMPGLLTVGVPYVAVVFVPRIGARAVGYYVSSLVAGGLVGRLGVALVTSLAGWRVALGTLAVLPLVATIVLRRTLPPEPEGEAGDDVRSGSPIRALLRNRTLVAATLVGSSLFFAFVGASSFVDFRLERAPFSLPPVAASLVFALWLLGAVAPSAGRVAGWLGWRRVALGSLLLSAGGLALSLTSVLPLLVVGLALFAVGNFAGVTATQLGVAESTDHDRGAASAVYYSAYYLAGGLGGYVPGLAWEAWRWNGVGLLSIAVLACGGVALALASTRSRRHTALLPAGARAA